MSEDFIEHRVEKGTPVWRAAKDMAALSHLQGKPVLAQFNSWVLLAEPGDTQEAICDGYARSMRLSGDRLMRTA